LNLFILFNFFVGFQNVLLPINSNVKKKYKKSIN